MPRKLKNVTGFGDVNYTQYQGLQTSSDIQKFLRPNVPGVVYNLDKTPYRPELEEKKSQMSEASYNGERNRIVPKEADYIMSHTQEIINHMINERTEFTYKADQKLVDQLGKKMVEDYHPLTSKERSERSKLSDAMRKKYTEYVAKRDLTISIVNRQGNGDILGRTNHCLLDVSFTEESIKQNDVVKGFLNSTDKKEKAKAYGYRIQQLMDIDISKIDLNDDRYILEHFDELAPIISSSVELKSLVDSYQELSGEDMTGEEYKPVFAKLGAITDLGYFLRMKIDIMTSPVYSQLRTEELYGKTNVLSYYTDLEGNEIELNQYFFDTDDPHKEYVSPLEQIGVFNTISGLSNHVLIDKNLTPEKRFEAYYSHYWDRKPEVVPLERKPEKEEVREDPYEGMINIEELEKKQDEYEKMRDRDKAIYNSIPEYEEPVNPTFNDDKKIQIKAHDIGEKSELPDINMFRQAPKDAYINEDDYYDDFANDEDLKDIQEDSLSEDQANEIKTEVEHQIEAENQEIEEDIQIEQRKFVPIPEPTEQELQAARYDMMLRANIEKIKTIVPDFKISEEQIKAYTDPKRFELREKAIRYQEKQDNITGKGYNIPPALNRAIFAMTKHPDEPGAKEYNDDLIKLVTDPTVKGDEFRHELFVRLTNDIKRIDRHALTPGRSFVEKAEYALAHMDILELGVESQRSYAQLSNSFGFDFNDELKSDIKETMGKGVALGGVGRAVKEALQSDYLFTMPFEQLNSDQLYKILDSKIKLDGFDRTQIPMLMSFSPSMGLANKYTEPNDHVYTVNDLHSTLPNLDQIAEKAKDTLTKLKEAKSFFGFTDSSEYRSLVSAVEKLSNVATAKDTATLGTALGEALKEVSSTASAYSRHVGKTPKNATQKTRLDLSDDIKSFVSSIKDDLMSGLIVDNYLEQETQEIIDSKTIVDPMSLKETTKAMKMEDTFNEGLKVTESMRQKVENLKPGLKRDLMQIALDSRDRLTELVGRDEVDLYEVRACIAKVVTGNILAPKFSDISETIPSNEKAILTYTEKVNSLIENPDFQKLTDGFDSDMINDFLSPSGGKKFTDSLLQAIKESKTKAQVKENVLAGKVKDDLDVGVKAPEDPKKEGIVKSSGGANMI